MQNEAYSMWRVGLSIVTMLLLAACASDKGLAPQAHVLSAPTNSAWQLNPHWWQQFNDPQLNSLIETALQHAPDIALAEARIRRARSAAEFSTDQLKAIYSIDGSAVRQKLSAAGYFPPPIGGSTFNLGQLTPDFYYDFDWWGKHRAVAQAAMGSIAEAEAEASAAQLSLTISIATHYFALQSAYAQATLIQHILDSQHTLYAVLHAQAQSGLLSHQQVFPIQGEIAETQRKLSVLTLNITQERFAISALIGEPPNFGLRINPQPLAIAPVWPQQAPMDLIGMRPDVLAKRATIEIATAQSALAKIQFYPDISLSGMVGFQSIGFENLFQSNSLMGSFGPAIHLPIFNQGSLRADLRTQYAEYDIAVQSYNHTVLEAMRQTASAFSATQAISTQIAAQQTFVNSLKNSAQLAAARYAAGLQDDVPVLQTTLALADAEQGSIQLAQQNLTASLDLIQALGGLPEAPHTDFDPQWKKGKQ